MKEINESYLGSFFVCINLVKETKLVLGGYLYMEYEKVPEIITGKDLEYLQDMFNWNYGAYKNTIDALDMVEDTELENHLEKSVEIFYTAMEDILSILEGGLNEDSK